MPARPNTGSAKRVANTSSAKPKAKRKAWFASTPRVPLFVGLFLVVWVFLYVWYGDVMAVAEQRGFFAFDSLAMQEYLCQPLGWLYATGRFMLLSCVSPLLGTLLIALMLVLTAWLVDRAFSLRGWWHAVAVVLPFCYFAYLFYRGLNLVYLRELSWIMTIPLIALAVSLVLALIMKIASKRKLSLKAMFSQVEARSGRQVWCLYGVMLLLFAGSVAMAETYAENDRVTCKMERLMYDEDWDGMVAAAKSASHPSRTVMGLYVVALNQNGQMANELFNIPMQYRNAHLSRKSGDFDAGMDFIVINCNFYAGLTRSAYHEAMEQTVLEGPSIDKMKTMVKCALIDKENALAEKYLAILSKVPFEGDFVEKYSAMLQNYNLVLQDATLASVIELQPVHDTFEQGFREPMFLGYNICLTEAKSLRGLYNSLYACLYSKDLVSFGQRILTLIENKVPLTRIFEEALVVQNIKDVSVLKGLNLSQNSLQVMKEFMGECFTSQDKATLNLSKEEKNELAKKKGKKYKDKYLGTYEFYYYFQNVPDENYSAPIEVEKGGVN